MSIVEVQQQETNANGTSTACVLPQLRGLSVVFQWLCMLDVLSFRTITETHGSSRERFSSTRTDACLTSNRASRRVLGSTLFEQHQSISSTCPTSAIDLSSLYQFLSLSLFARIHHVALTMPGITLDNVKSTGFYSNRIRAPVEQDSESCCSSSSTTFFQ